VSGACGVEPRSLGRGAHLNSAPGLDATEPANWEVRESGMLGPGKLEATCRWRALGA
jgi:hypothetical protein